MSENSPSIGLNDQNLQKNTETQQTGEIKNENMMEIEEEDKKVDEKQNNKDNLKIDDQNINQKDIKKVEDLK